MMAASIVIASLAVWPILAPSFWQDGPPELPGEVEGLPLDFWTWLLLICAAGVVLWGLVGWVDQFVQRRKLVRTQQNAAAVQVADSSIVTLVEELRGALKNLSATQREEAERLSWLLREEMGNRRQLDCHSATDTELLQYSEDAEKLEPLLAFASGVLYANNRPMALDWACKLDYVCDWLALTAEVRT